MGKLITENQKEETYDSSFPKKWKNKLPPEPEETMSRIDAMSDEELKQKIVIWSQAIAVHEADQDKDEVLNSLKEDTKSRLDLFRGPIKECESQIRYATFVLTSRGK